MSDNNKKEATEQESFESRFGMVHAKLRTQYLDQAVAQSATLRKNRAELEASKNRIKELEDNISRLEAAVAALDDLKKEAYYDEEDFRHKSARE